MGLILNGVQIIKQKYKHCLKMASSVNTKVLNSELHEFVFDCFEYLKPLSYTFKHVTYDRGDEIIIREWVRCKLQGHKIGFLVDWPKAFFDTIREHGELMKPLVRKSISEDFSALVDLTAKLKPYNNALFKVDVPRLTAYKVCPIHDIGDEEIEVVALGLETANSGTLILYGSDGYNYRKDITDPLSFMMMEDLADYAIELYEDVRAKLLSTIEHNDKIMRKMREVIAPFIVAKEVGR